MNIAKLQKRNNIIFCSFALTFFSLFLLSIVVDNARFSSFFGLIIWLGTVSAELYMNIKIRKAEKQYAKAYIIQKICDFNPDAQKSQEAIIAKEYPKDFMSILDENKGHEPNFTEIREETTQDANFLRFLFRLAIADDGIKDDEWEYIDTIADEINIPPHIKKYIQKYYEPLRRGAEYEKQKEQEEKIQQYTYKNATKSAYTILGVSEHATMEEIQKRYRKLALEYHPDLPKNAERQKECEEKMKEINIAYEKIIYGSPFFRQ